MGLMLGNVSAHDLILDGQSVSLYVGGTPPVKVWPTRETVQIRLNTGLGAKDQFRAALADRGLDYKKVTEIPFDIELVGTGSTREMFYGCSSLTHAPDLDTTQVTNMYEMFSACFALTSVPDLGTAQVTNMYRMFNYCSALTDGNVRLIGRHRSVTTTGMIQGSGLTRLPFYDTAGNPI